VTRANRITVKAYGRDGQPFQLQADGLLAICIQHEMDHLEGKLFVDYLSQLKREQVRKKLEKARRNSAA
jgi:peptide deformylase